MSKKMKLPFSMMPASWGLKGKARARAEAEYYYEGEELEKVLAGIDAETDKDKTIAELDIDLKNEKISKSDYDLKIANLNEEPFVSVVHMDLNEENANAGYIELDWNDHFIKYLHEHGYTGTSDDDVVNKWFNDVCRTVLMQEKADLDYGMQDQERDDVIRRTKGRDESED
jgi:hypothetical protein